MANGFVNYLIRASEDTNFHDYQHASRLYLDNTYELTPKPSWIYYVVVNINPAIGDLIVDPDLSLQYEAWYNRYRGTVGLLAKQVDMPKFTIETEVFNQYNRKTVVQKKINYSPVSITFHDDMANATTNFWKAYYQYYFGDSRGAIVTGLSSNPLHKYGNNKYDEYIEQQNYQYGLNNGQTIPFLNSIDIYQLYQQKFTSFKIVNPIIKEWSHDQLDQTSSNKLLTSKMTVDYETVIYDTDATNQTTTENPGFANTYYDNTLSPIRTSLDPPPEQGPLPGKDDVFGKKDNPGPNILDFVNLARRTSKLAKAAKNLPKGRVVQEGLNIFNSALSKVDPDGNLITDTLNKMNQPLNPAGILVPPGKKDGTDVAATLLKLAIKKI